VIIRREDQLSDMQNETLFQFGGERVLVELQVQGSSALIKVGVGAQTKDVIIRVVVTSVGGGAERASEECPSVERGSGFLR